MKTVGATLLFDQSGIYSPVIIEDSYVEWWRNEDGDPLYGVQVNNPEHAATFAAVHILQPLLIDGALQAAIDAANADLLAEEWGIFQTQCSKPLSARDAMNRIHFDGSIEDDHEDIRRGY